MILTKINLDQIMIWFLTFWIWMTFRRSDWNKISNRTSQWSHTSLLTCNKFRIISISKTFTQRHVSSTLDMEGTSYNNAKLQHNKSYDSAQDSTSKCLLKTYLQKRFHMACWTFEALRELFNYDDQNLIATCFCLLIIDIWISETNCCTCVLKSIKPWGILNC